MGLPTRPESAAQADAQTDEAAPLLPVPSSGTPLSCSAGATTLSIPTSQTYAVNSAGRGLKRLVKCRRPQWSPGLMRRLSSNRNCFAESGRDPFHPDRSRRYGAVCAYTPPREFPILLIRQPLRATCTSGVPAPTHSLAYRLMTGEPGHMIGCLLCVCAGLVVCVRRFSALAP